MAEELRSTVIRLLGAVAPEADLATISGSVDLRDQLDIDSIDLLNLIVSVHRELGVDIPERDYGNLVTLDGMCAYLAAKLAGKG